MDRTDGNELITGLNFTPSDNLSAGHGQILVSGPDAGTVTFGTLTIPPASTLEGSMVASGVELTDHDFTIRCFSSFSPLYGFNIPLTYLFLQGSLAPLRGTGIYWQGPTIPGGFLNFVVGDGVNFSRTACVIPFPASPPTHIVCIYRSATRDLDLYTNSIFQFFDPSEILNVAPTPPDSTLLLSNHNYGSGPAVPMTVSSLGIWDYAWDAETIECDYKLGAPDPIV